MFSNEVQSHSCGGSDSSLLFIIATTGIVGGLIFLNLVLEILKTLSHDKTFLVCGLALFVHSLFVHSLFYPWVMGWMGILLAVSLSDLNS